MNRPHAPHPLSALLLALAVAVSGFVGTVAWAPL